MNLKQIIYLFATVAVVLGVSSCGSDGGGGNPYDNQVQRPFYPSKVSFKSVNNNNEKVEEVWTFEYNEDRTISRYTCSRSEISSVGEVNENIEGKLRYYKKFNDERAIEAVITSDYSSYNDFSQHNKLNAYRDTLREDVSFSGDLITSIVTSGVRSYENREPGHISYAKTFTYSGDYCTGYTYKDLDGEITYSYKWSGEKLYKVSAYEQNNDYSRVLHRNYEYTYSKNEYSSDYGFNPMAFIYGHNPVVYAAMSYFGKVTPYMLENEEYSYYETVDGKTQPRSTLNIGYNNIDQENYIYYTADSDNYSEYTFIFSK